MDFLLLACANNVNLTIQYINYQLDALIIIYL